ncbi:hypothetical protein CcaverHIS002_0504880 [Cutaneotrichosporon cavernicola]|uniref:Uncharacterized protein n=1 Tax=Cutaneotrichosporon cavernicola TaxID=279322 RepID=A0AA48L6J6_9TREE|nr:uncharacterized protein CcaverHIS019_0505420 [Cutaneotrichosporon cavernicola]BEI85087.1 hypothetical protein CcaverHIS002_0504880 [Cutaneotrichosporon cavernicola]BEI92914.1 hypothetical protein CcaverHIS019_0505420 [Cutaneotrichosporon cavernicola]BEJ00690.1 hypothetical protein CcaverHIS631_0505470 [Cutaneotrichosporon cavernicola]BEJ08457.1 hypothetical protein CcaverHIS641_0505510 [Cutaneotrichosporon cavernicola]
MLPSYTLPPDTLFSFAHRPVTSRSRLNASLRTSWAVSTATTATTSSANPSQGPSPGLKHSAAAASSASFTATAHRLRRPRHRALRGLPAAGASLHLLAADLSDEEGVLDEEREDLNNFGRRFLIPIGRRNTQMEAEAAPSPTPSDHDHRQEDRGGVSPSLEPMDDVDLDASVDDLDAPDLDASIEDMDRSTEYDSEDMAFMNEMDRSIGSESHGESMED